MSDDVTPNVALFDAYEAAADPKPSLGTIIKKIRNGEFPGYSDPETSMIFVTSREQFAADLATWIEITDWKSGGFRPVSAVPEGYVRITDYVRSNVSMEAGLNAGLFVGDRSKPKSVGLSDTFRSQITGGAIRSARKIAGGAAGEWIANEHHIRDFLFARWNVRII